MAVGLGRMMNIQLPVNFDSPYKAVTITEFWGRWHKTLTRFFTKYIYIPMGGNRKGTWRTYLNVMVVYLVSGLWHGANWTFIFWGLLHGTFCVITRHWKKQIDAMPRFLNWMCTFLFLNISWVFFRADTIADGFALLKQAAAFDFGAIHNQFAVVFNLKEITLPVIWLLNIDMNQAYPYHITIFAYIAALVIAIFMPNAYERMERFDGSVWTMVITAFLFVWCIFSLSGVSTFLYFNF